MSSNSDASKALEERIEALIRYAEKLRLEKQELHERKEELEKNIEEKEARIGELEAKVEELGKPGLGNASSVQRKEAERRIDGMIQEIDRCIALLDQ